MKKGEDWVRTRVHEWNSKDEESHSQGATGLLKRLLALPLRLLSSYRLTSPGTWHPVQEKHGSSMLPAHVELLFPIL